MQADSAPAANWTSPDVRVRSCVAYDNRCFSTYMVSYTIYRRSSHQVKGFIFDFPSSPATRCELLDIVTVNLQIGDETIAVGNFAIVFSNNLNR